MPLPAKFDEVLTLLGKAFVIYHDLGGSNAVLVGGAVVSIFTQGAFMSGDFDCLVSFDEAFHEALTRQGFVREKQQRRLRGGWFHPAYPEYSIDSVSRPYFDGYADVDRIRVLVMGPDSRVNVAPPEDMIADRLGQYAAAPGDPAPLRQAKLLLQLAGPLDEVYLRKRVADEQGNMRDLGEAFQ